MLSQQTGKAQAPLRHVSVLQWPIDGWDTKNFRELLNALAVHWLDLRTRVLVGCRVKLCGWLRPWLLRLAMISRPAWVTFMKAWTKDVVGRVLNPLVAYGLIFASESTWLACLAIGLYSVIWLSFGALLHPACQVNLAQFYERVSNATTATTTTKLLLQKTEAETTRTPLIVL